MRFPAGCLVILSFVACGDDAAPAPTPSAAEPAPEVAAEAAPESAAEPEPESPVEPPSQDETTEPAVEADPMEPQTVEERVRAELADIAEEITSLSAVGEVSLPSGEAHVFQATLRDDTEEVLYAVVAMPGEDDPPVHALDLGTTEMLLGGELETELESFGELSVEDSFVRAELTTRESSAEFATDGECEQRDQSPTVQTGFSLICGVEDCVAIRRSRTVVSPGFERDCDGRRTSSDAGDPPYELTVEIEDAEHVRLTLVSGTVPPEELGVIAITDLSRDRAVQAL